MSPESNGQGLSSLSSSFAAGPDGLHLHLLKACSAARSLPFYLPICKISR